MRGRLTTEKLALKAQKWGRLYVKNNFNGTKTTLQTYDTKNPNTAAAIASENLRKPNIREVILEELEKQGMTQDTTAKIHKRNITQAKNISASNVALDMKYRLEGAYAPEERTTRTITMNLNSPEDIEKALQILKEQMKELDNG